MYTSDIEQTVAQKKPQFQKDIPECGGRSLNK